MKFHLPRNRRDHRMAGLFPSLLLLLVPLSLTALAGAVPSSPHDKLFPDKIARELAGYQDVVEQIVDYAVNGPGQNQSYERLATFTDAFGSRLSGIIHTVVKPLQLTKSIVIAPLLNVLMLLTAAVGNSKSEENVC